MGSLRPKRFLLCMQNEQAEACKSVPESRNRVVSEAGIEQLAFCQRVDLHGLSGRIKISTKKAAPSSEYASLDGPACDLVLQ